MATKRLHAASVASASSGWLCVTVSTLIMVGCADARLTHILLPQLRQPPRPGPRRLHRDCAPAGYSSTRLTGRLRVVTAVVRSRRRPGRIRRAGLGWNVTITARTYVFIFMVFFCQQRRATALCAILLVIINLWQFWQTNKMLPLFDPLTFQTPQQPPQPTLSDEEVNATSSPTPNNDL
jgi:hypothetical protein